MTKPLLVVWVQMGTNLFRARLSRYTLDAWPCPVSNGKFHYEITPTSPTLKGVATSLQGAQNGAEDALRRHLAQTGEKKFMEAMSQLLGRRKQELDFVEGRSIE